MGLISSTDGVRELLPVMRWNTSIGCIKEVACPATMEVILLAKETSSSTPNLSSLDWSAKVSLMPGLASSIQSTMNRQ